MADNELALRPGYELQEYRIESTLGVGGFGLTYLATDTNLNLQIALKEYLPGDLALRRDDQSIVPKSDDMVDTFKWGLERFLDEAYVARAAKEYAPTTGIGAGGDEKNRLATFHPERLEQYAVDMAVLLEEVVLVVTVVGPPPPLPPPPPPVEPVAVSPAIDAYALITSVSPVLATAC